MLVLNLSNRQENENNTLFQAPEKLCSTNVFWASIPWRLKLQRRLPLSA